MIGAEHITFAKFQKTVTQRRIENRFADDGTRRQAEHGFDAGHLCQCHRETFEAVEACGFEHVRIDVGNERDLVAAEDATHHAVGCEHRIVGREHRFDRTIERKLARERDRRKRQHEGDNEQRNVRGDERFAQGFGHDSRASLSALAAVRHASTRSRRQKPRRDKGLRNINLS